MYTELVMMGRAGPCVPTRAVQNGVIASQSDGERGPECKPNISLKLKEVLFLVDSQVVNPIMECQID